MINKYFSVISKQYTIQRLTRVFDLVKQNKSKIYLDCGCDDGKLTKKIARFAKAKKVFGVDVNENSLKTAKANGIKVYKRDLNTPLMMLKSLSIDLITSLETIEHLTEVDIFLSEIYRLLSPGGTFIVTTENLASWHNVVALILGNQPYTGPYISRKFPLGHRPFGYYWNEKERNQMPPHTSVMTIKSLIELLKCYNFIIKEVHPVGYYPFPIGISNVISRLDANHSVYVVIKALKPS